MPSNTTFDPKSAVDFDKSKMIYNAQGITATPTIHVNSNIDLTLTDDHLITGFWVIGANCTLGDKIDLQVTDPSNLFGFGAGAVIRQFATDIYLPAGAFDVQFDVAYPAKIYAGLNLRIVYHSAAALIVGLVPTFCINYKLHKVLV